MCCIPVFENSTLISLIIGKVLYSYPHSCKRLSPGCARAEDEPKVESDIGADKEGSRTDDGVVAREEEAIKLDGLNVAQVSPGSCSINL